MQTQLVLLYTQLMRMQANQATDVARLPKKGQAMTQSTIEKIERDPKSDSARRSLVRTGGIAIVAATVFAAIAFLIADAATGGLWVTPMGGETPEEISLDVALFMTPMGGVIGIGFAFAARRFAHRPNTQGWCHATQLR
jgi:cation transporter-like permease